METIEALLPAERHSCERGTVRGCRSAFSRLEHFCARVDNVTVGAGALGTVLEELAGEILVDWAGAERTVFSSFLAKNSCPTRPLSGAADRERFLSFPSAHLPNLFGL